MIRVGGATEVEVKEKKDRVDDALNATRAAVEEGVSPGGGVALLRAIKALDSVKVGNSDQKTGVDIVRKAIQAPARQIVDNAGGDGAVVVGKLLEAKDYGYGYDAQTGEYRRSGQARHHRPDQGRAHRAAGRGLDRRPDHHHRGDDHRTSEEGSARPCRAAAWAAWAVWTTDVPKSAEAPTKRPWGQFSRAFSRSTTETARQFIRGGPLLSLG